LNNTNVSTNYAWLKYSDILVAVAVVMIVVMMVIPLPPYVLDVLISFNITFGVLSLLMTFYIGKPLDFSVFPSLLLVATLYRLALNVSTTRSILLHAYAGKVIVAFGKFVVGGNVIVGIIVFLILVIIQFIVITKGAERVAEVAARFTLDAMPGKQMSIDADLNAGLITDAEARARRAEIQREADFYGAMDGASKFVKGDAIAGIIITIVNIVGGLSVGVLQKGMSLSEAVSTYTILTVGDGLSAQIPALILSTATGIIVTRAASEHNLGRDLVKQLTSQPRPLFIASGMLLFLGAIPGLPTLPFWVLGGAIGALAYSMRRAALKEKVISKEEAKKVEEKRKGPEDVSSLIQVDPMEIDIGYSLIPLVDPKQGGDMLDRITMIRRQMAMEMGIIVPPIRIRDDMRLEPDEYVIKIKGADVGRAKLMVDHFLAMNPGIAEGEIEGIPTTEPAFGLPAIWITEDVKHKAESLGYTVVDPPSVMATHLTEVIKRYAADLLTRQDVRKLIDMVKENYPAVVEEMSKVLEVGDVQKVLQNLLKEGVPIKDMVTILETLTDYAKVTNDVILLTEYVRASLARHITQLYQSPDGVIRVITLSPDVEEAVASGVSRTETGVNIAIEPALASKIVNSLAKVIEDVASKGIQPIVLCSPKIRYYFKVFVQHNFPTLVVLSYNEISPTAKVESVGVVTL